jgi:hypothetical protein
MGEPQTHSVVAEIIRKCNSDRLLSLLLLLLISIASKQDQEQGQEQEADLDLCLFSGPV